MEHLRGSEQPLLLLSTCQRLEVYGPEGLELPGVPVGEAARDRVAFERLARIAAGLESRVLGELEVLGQVRDAYNDFRARFGAGHRGLDRSFQAALALARRARKESGIDRQMTSLGGLACRELLGRVPAGRPLAVIGAGSLASSVVRHLGRRGKSPVRVSSRCPRDAARLAGRIRGFSAGLQELSRLLDGVAGIITATAAPHPVLYAEHLGGTARPLYIIDLGVPPDCSEDVPPLPGVHYVGLEEIEHRAQGNAEQRRQRAAIAAEIIREGAAAWARRR